MVKLICPGLSRTGTRTLAEALTILGYPVAHWEPERLRDLILARTSDPDFRRYDDVQAILDLPASLFYRELLSAYPGSRVILTVRDEQSWFASVSSHYLRVREDLSGELLEEAIHTQTMAYGTSFPNRFVYCKRFREHNQAVMDFCPDVLLMDIVGGDGWDKLCGWLGAAAPNLEFPRLGGNESW
jgi:hypothetical protein